MRGRGQTADSNGNNGATQGGWWLGQLKEGAANIVKNMKGVSNKLSSSFTVGYVDVVVVGHFFVITLVHCSYKSVRITL